MIHHPQFDMIKKYAIGELNSPLSLMVSAHLSVCSECSLQYHDCLRTHSHECESQSVDLASTELDQAFDLIMNKVKDSHSHTMLERPAPEEISIDVSGQCIQLPRSMGFLKDKPISWKEFGKSNAIAPVVIGPSGNFYLIYIGPGECVPQHDHTGREYTYVVAGSYHDGISSYETGDFSLSNSGHPHTPRATSDDGCLVISWVEGRLNYFSGILRPLNSILWWYLHRA